MTVYVCDDVSTSSFAVPALVQRTPDGNSTSVTVSGRDVLQPMRQYCFFVTAYSQAGQGETWSIDNIVAATQGLTPPEEIITTTALPLNNSTLVTWRGERSSGVSLPRARPVCS